MKTNILILMAFVLTSTFFAGCGLFKNSNAVEVPWQGYAWACKGQGGQPQIIYKHQLYGQWRIGYEDTDNNVMVFTGYNWSNVNMLPGLGNGVTIGGFQWIILEVTNNFTSPTTANCSSYCAQFCANADATYGGTFVIAETGQTVCNCIYR